jgi:hypothetical protein
MNWHQVSICWSLKQIPIITLEKLLKNKFYQNTINPMPVE